MNLLLRVRHALTLQRHPLDHSMIVDLAFLEDRNAFQVILRLPKISNWPTVRSSMHRVKADALRPLALAEPVRLSNCVPKFLSVRNFQFHFQS